MKITRRMVWQKSRLEQKPRELPNSRSGRIIAALYAGDLERLCENLESVGFALEISLHRASCLGLLNQAGKILNSFVSGFAN